MVTPGGCWWVRYSPTVPPPPGGAKRSGRSGQGRGPVLLAVPGAAAPGWEVGLTPFGLRGRLYTLFDTGALVSCFQLDRQTESAVQPKRQRRQGLAHGEQFTPYVQ